jgi:hypothetical protein
MYIRKISVTGDVVIFFTQDVLIPEDWTHYSQGKELELWVFQNHSGVKSWYIKEFTSQNI